MPIFFGFMNPMLSDTSSETGSGTLTYVSSFSMTYETQDISFLQRIGAYTLSEDEVRLLEQFRARRTETPNPLLEKRRIILLDEPEPEKK